MFQTLNAIAHTPASEITEPISHEFEPYESASIAETVWQSLARSIRDVRRCDDVFTGGQVAPAQSNERKQARNPLWRRPVLLIHRWAEHPCHSRPRTPRHGGNGGCRPSPAQGPTSNWTEP